MKHLPKSLKFIVIIRPKTSSEFPPRLLNLVDINLSNPLNAIAYIWIYKFYFGGDKKIFFFHPFIHVLFHAYINIFLVDQGWSNALDLKCTPNETYKDDCNTCICSSDGRTAACTLVRCVALPEVSTVGSETTTEQTHHENQPSTTEAALEHIENNNHVCTPNDIKIQVC